MRKKKTITREAFVTFVNSEVRKNAEYYGPRPEHSGVVDHESIDMSRVLMNVFNDYRGFKIRTAANGATYAEYH